MIFEPPRHGKSWYVSKYLPPWYLGCHPDHRVILSSYSQRLASNYSGQGRDLFAEYGPHYFGLTVQQGGKSKSEWDIAGHDGGMLACGVGGAATGYGAHLFIIDDPVKNAEEAASEAIQERNRHWWESVVSTRLEPDSLLILMNTRWHKKDLSGYLLEKEPDLWDVLCLPAIAEDDDPMGRTPGEALWPERYPVDALEQIRLNKTPYWWQAMYQQRPGLFSEASWPAEYFHNIWADEWPSEFELSALVVDPATGKGRSKKRGDYSAVVFAGKADRKMWFDVWLGKVPVEVLLREMIARYVRYKPDVLACEGNGFQEWIAPLWRQAADEAGLLGVDCTTFDSTGDKINRIEAALTPLLSRHAVKMCGKTAGNRLAVEQMQMIPNGDHEDGPDAMASALRTALDFFCGQQNSDPFGRTIYERN